MNGMSIHALRAAGTAVRHAHGVNTCARCLQHYFHAAQTSVEEGCAIHTSELTGEGAQRGYPCCNTVEGSKGCTPAAHLPMFQCIDGKIQSNKRIEYDPKINLQVGRWVNARVSVGQLSKEAAAASSSPASSSSSSSSSSAAPRDPAAASVTSSVLRSIPHTPGAIGAPVPRVGDEIMVCGQLYHTGTPVILWGDVGGYDHYRTERRFCPFPEADWATTQRMLPNFTTPNRFGLRKDGLTDAEIEAVRGGQWDLLTLQKQMKAFVLHYDEVGLSIECFRVLQDERDLSIHFMCDLDGTIYQALDLKERAWQATIENTNSVGCEIANIGAYDPAGPNPFADWYGKNAQGETIIKIDPTKWPDNGHIHTPGFVGQPARPDPIAGVIQGQNLIQYDYTPQQYAALQKLIATFCTIFPNVPATYPKDGTGHLIRQKLPDSELATYTGLLGHYHIQTNKIDPGPAFQWNLVSEGAQAIMKQNKCEQQAQLAAASKTASSSSSSAPALAAASSNNTSKTTEWNVMRKLERKLFHAAEEAAARSLRDTEEFWLVEAGWWAGWKAWLACTDASVPRPGPVSNLALLCADERTPRPGLQFVRDYRAVSARVWQEMVDLYEADATLVRDSTDIYVRKPADGNAPAPPRAAAAAASSIAPAASNFVVPAISSEGDDTWIVVAKRASA